MDVNVLREAHRFQHLWAEHTAVTNFYPFAQLWVEGKNFEGRL